MDDRYLPADVVLAIVRRLPPSARRRSRLVCRLWHDVVTHRTPEMQSRPKALLWYPSSTAVSIVDPCSASPSPRELRTSPRKGLALVGTSNGILCAVTLANPVTGETMPVPALPWAAQFVGQLPCTGYKVRWAKAYGIGCHPVTGEYKVVHVPCCFDRVCEFDAVHVLTVGGKEKNPTWRESPVSIPGGAKCELAAGIVTVDGATHWAATIGGSARVVSLDLAAERVAPTTVPLPAARSGGYYRLAEVRGRLGLVTYPEVWVLDKDRRRWSVACRIEQDVSLPHFEFGEFVLAQRGRSSFYRHRRRKGDGGGIWRPRCEFDGVVRVDWRDEGTVVCDGYYQIFAFC
ncbi:hypothetical protein BRADI_2g38890v3 [Brachypodium distachyon]|uniref:F-box domain-containing protein n=1 Tax=Brachypodium distachyon TaxID=15368 RepID=A0A0Q3G9I6_BRADI|nr:hypothetical protein BRADI_2g38890v3 [Brachypodium distachyon]